jgi:membrane-bound lytic murein transglycosylase D
MMMKQKLFIAVIVGIGFITVSFTDDGGKRKKATPAASKTAKKKVSTTLSDTTQAPEEAKTATIPDLFETSSSNGVKLNPRAVSFVQDYMETHGKDLLKMKDWGRPYFNMMDAVLSKYNLPIELKYLAVIESKLKSTAVSWAGAVGPWQFMPQTARDLGLIVNHKVDERTNYIKSTHAAAKYLRDLYSEFGDWLLVIAAYNGGPGNVYSAIKKGGGSRNFWMIQRHLPNETRNHVKKFIGTHYIFEGQGGITTLTKAETIEQIHAVSQILSDRNLSESEQANVKSVKVSGKYHSTVIARIVMMEIDDFNRYNPNFDRVMALAENSYELKLPAEKMELFVANKYQILNESVQLLLSGATVSAITTSYNRGNK